MPQIPPPPLPAGLATSAASRYEQCLEAAERDAVELPPLAELPGDAERVWACSEFVARSCIADPAMLADLLSSTDLANRYEVVGSTAATIAEACSDEAALALALRRLRRREMLRVAWRDIGALAGLEEILRDTSDLADAIVDAALGRLHGWQREKLGEPTSLADVPQRLVVLALGKLGAHELNFSSDIDLLFAFPEPGETVGGKREVSNEEFFTRLGQRLIHVLDHAGPGGIVYRVDMRLRPFGNSGPLVVSFDGLEHYYQTHGRDWERYAMIRARAVAGDIAEGEALLERLRPFVYRRYMDFSALESLREMKVLITTEIERKGLQDNVKLGPGGIREIEFTGQAFQMVRGGRQPELRDRRIENVLRILGKLDLMPGYAVAGLRDAYRFLRTVEHRLQQWQDQQTHMLPDDDEARERLAAGMRESNWPALARVVGRHRARVTAQFDQVFGAVDSGDSEEGSALNTLWNMGDEDQPRALAVLEEAGVQEPAGVWSEVQKLRNDARLLDKRSRERVKRLLPALVSLLGTRHEPLCTTQRVFAVLQSVARRSIYLALLTERPLALGQLVTLCSASPMIARDVGGHPLLLDELLDPRTLYHPLSRTELEADLDMRLASIAAGDTEQEMEALRQFQHANLLRVAAADVSHAMPLMVVSDHLTWLAEVVVERSFALARRDLVARHGEPRHTTPEGVREVAPFAVIAYGKMGGLELGYGSDLDLVFVHGSEGEEQHCDGEKQVDNAVFFGRLAQRMIHFLTTRTAGGRLYEVDSRLRPSGSAGLLVTSMRGLELYLRDEAWTWEHQALVRARIVAGSKSLGARFSALRRELLLQARDAEKLRAEVREMRERMRQELGSRDDAVFDIKQDPGGIADIEFMVQYGALRYAPELGSHLDFTDNIRLLEGFAANGLMSQADAQTLADAYRAYRARVHELALQENRPVVAAGEFAEQRETVGRIWHALMDDNT